VREGFVTNELIFAVTSLSTTLVHNMKKRLLLGERSGIGTAGETLSTSVDDFLSILLELVGDTDESVVLGNTFGSARSTSLNFSYTQRDDEVRDGCIFGLTRSVGNHDTPSIGLSELSSLDRLGDGTDLVDLEEETVASLLLNGSLDPRGVGDSQVITNDLDLGVLGKVSPGLPVILVEGVFDRDNVRTSRRARCRHQRVALR